MATIDRLGERTEMPNMHDGNGMTLAYSFFDGDIDKSTMFFDLVVKPRTYVGYHRHTGNEEILYIVSGKAENFQHGSRQVLEAGDAILIKSGESHAIRNVGAEDLRVLGFVATPGDGIGAVENLPFPEAISDWDQ
jgi:quercetin dioxygenase-like cupin family protein